MAGKYGPKVSQGHVWCLAGDGCMMEGIAYEAASLAGHLGLNNLTLIYDKNDVTIDGSAEITFTEDVAARFEAMHWRVIKVSAYDALGALRLAAGETGPAKEAFESVIKLSPDNELAQRAKGYIFEIEHLQPGMVAPVFTARTLDGAEFSSASLRGTPFLLNFWASWCPRCVGEVPELKAAVQTMQEKGRPFEVVAVSIDEDDKSVAATAQAVGMPGIILRPEGGFEHPVAKLFNVQSMPTWYLIDAEGIIRARDPLGKKLPAALEALEKAKGPAHGGA